MRGEDRMRGLGLGGVVKCWDCQSSIEGQHRPECSKTYTGGIFGRADLVEKFKEELEKTDSSWSERRTAMRCSYDYPAARAAAKEFNKRVGPTVPADPELQVLLDKTNDKASERKMTPLWSGLVKYFPDALIAVARLSQVANDQHNPGEPLHWARGKSMDQEDCLLRHLWDAGTVDTDGQRHSAKVAWRALAMLQLELEAADKEKTL